MRQKVIIYGNGEFAEQIKLKFDADSKFEIIAFTTVGCFIKEDIFLGLPLICFENITEIYPPTEFKIFIAIGYSRINELRESVYFTCKEKGYSFVTYISSNATIWGDVKIGESSYIGDGVVISPKCVVGNGVIIFPSTVLGHGVIVDDFAYLSICVAVGGYAKVKKNCFIGMHVTVRDHVIVEEKVILGAAANLVSSTMPNSVYVGNPAKLLRKNSDKTLI